MLGSSDVEIAEDQGLDLITRHVGTDDRAIARIDDVVALGMPAPAPANTEVEIQSD